MHVVEGAYKPYTDIIALCLTFVDFRCAMQRKQQQQQQ